MGNSLEVNMHSHNLWNKYKIEYNLEVKCNFSQILRVVIKSIV